MNPVDQMRQSVDRLKVAFVPSPQVQGQVQAAMAQHASLQQSGETAGAAQAQAQQQAQGAPPMMRIEDLAQMLGDGLGQLMQISTQILQMLQAQQMVQQAQAAAAPAPAPAGGGEGGGEGEKKKPEGGGEGGGGAAPAPAAAAGPTSGADLVNRISALEQGLQQLLATAGAAPAGAAPAPAAAPPAGGAPMM